MDSVRVCTMTRSSYVSKKKYKKNKKNQTNNRMATLQSWSNSL